MSTIPVTNTGATDGTTGTTRTTAGTTAGTTGTTTGTTAGIPSGTTTATTTTTPASQTGAHIGQQIKQGATGIHGIGEAIRGNINQAIDGAFGDTEGVAKNAGIAQKGLDEVDDGQYRGHPDSKPRF